MTRNRYSLPLVVGLTTVMMLAGFMVVMGGFQIAKTGFLNDDAFITLAYAKNLARGDGFIFNHPPASLGTTTPAYTLLLSILSWLLSFIDLVNLATAISTLCWIGIGALFVTFRKAWDITYVEAVLIAAFVLGYGSLGLIGMETYTWAFVFVLSCSVFLTQRYFLAGLLTGVLFLIRGEGSLLGPILVFYVLLVHFRPLNKANFISWVKCAAKITAGFAVPVCAWFLYSFASFGHVLPNSLSAKQAQMQSDLWRSFPERLLHEWLPRWGDHFKIFDVSLKPIWWSIIVLGLVYAAAKNRTWIIPVLWLALYIGGYSILGVSGYAWYQMPVLLVVHILFGLGLVCLFRLSKCINRPAYIALLPAALVAATFYLGQMKQMDGNLAKFKGDYRGPSYTALSEWINLNTPKDASIAFIEIGYLGYHTDRRIIDLAGLVMPDIVPHVSKGDFAWAMWNYQPDYYISLPEFKWALGKIEQDPKFKSEYLAVTNLPGPRKNDITVYARSNLSGK